MYTLSKLIPAMLILPTFRPVFSHLVNRSVFLRFNLAEPFVRFLFGLHCGLSFAINVYPVSLFLSALVGFLLL
jgi:hypothetical protein